MNNKIKKAVSLIMILSIIISIPSYAAAPTSFPEIANCKYLPCDKSLAWIPTEPMLIDNFFICYQVLYITKSEALAIAEGYKDSAFKNDLVKVLDYAQRTSSYSGGYLAGVQIVKIASKLGLKRIASFFSGIGGAITIGFMVDDFLNFIRYLDYNRFTAAVKDTPDNHHVKIIHKMTRDGHYRKSYEPYTNDYAFTLLPHDKVQSGTWSEDSKDFMIYQ